MITMELGNFMYNECLNDLSKTRDKLAQKIKKEKKPRRKGSKKPGVDSQSAFSLANTENTGTTELANYG